MINFEQINIDSILNKSDISIAAKHSFLERLIAFVQFDTGKTE